jgi:hypothetical protein
MLDTGTTRSGSPVYLAFARAPDNRRPREHTSLQYATPAHAEYHREWLRQLEEQRSSHPRGNDDADGGHRQQEQQHHGDGNQEGVIQGEQQEQYYQQQQTDDDDHRPPFRARNADAQQAFQQQNGQQTGFTVPMRRATDVWYCCSCSFRSGPYPAWMTECVECSEQHKRCQECLRHSIS